MLLIYKHKNTQAQALCANTDDLGVQPPMSECQSDMQVVRASRVHGDVLARPGWGLPVETPCLLPIDNKKMGDREKDAPGHGLVCQVLRKW